MDDKRKNMIETLSCELNDLFSLKNKKAQSVHKKNLQFGEGNKEGCCYSQIVIMKSIQNWVKGKRLMQK
jgi:hypothetical protein